VKGLTPFPRRIKLARGETVVFSWIVFKSRAHRDRVNTRVMKDKRLAASRSTSSAWSTEDSRSWSTSS